MVWTETLTALATAVAAVGAVASAGLLLYQFHLTKKPMFKTKLDLLWSHYTDSTLNIQNVSKNQARKVVIEFNLFEMENGDKKSEGKKLTNKVEILSYLNPRETIRLYFPISDLVRGHKNKFETRKLNDGAGDYELTAPKENLLCRVKVKIKARFGFLPIFNIETVEDDYLFEWVGWKSASKPNFTIWHEREGHYIEN